MANKKDFSAFGEKVTATIAQSTNTKRQRPTATPEEAAERQKNFKTQGKKGCKLIRINMGFTQENHDFIKVMAKASGKTMTVLVNDIIAEYKDTHSDMLDEIQAVIDKYNRK